MRTKPRFIFWTVGLVIVLLASACAPAGPTKPPQIQIPLTAATASPTPELIPFEGLSATPDTSTLVNTPVPTVQAIATSRGPNLEATDPTTVSLASGSIQLIEFFRFT